MSWKTSSSFLLFSSFVVAGFEGARKGTAGGAVNNGQCLLREEKLLFYVLLFMSKIGRV